MKQDIVVAGVGGQGIVSIAYVIDYAALKDGLNFKQSEVHGMAQRGGAVQSHLRISNDKIWSDLIPKGETDLVLSVEPVEALRYVEFLKPEGMIITSSVPYKNIPEYPDVATVVEAVKKTGKALVIDTEKLAREAGSVKAQNMVLLGAASPLLILKDESLRAGIQFLFAAKGKVVLEANFKAYELGKTAAV